MFLGLRANASTQPSVTYKYPSLPSNLVKMISVTCIHYIYTTAILVAKGWTSYRFLYWCFFILNSIELFILPGYYLWFTHCRTFFAGLSKELHYCTCMQSYLIQNEDLSPHVWSRRPFMERDLISALLKSRPLKSIPMKWIDSDLVRYFLRAPKRIPIAMKRIGTELNLELVNCELNRTEPYTQ